MKGRKPKPTALKLLEGNPGKRPLNLYEPKPDSKAPPTPSSLRGLALEEWNRIVPKLEALGLLTEIDMMPIEAYCVNYARWKDAEEKVAKMGPVVKTTAGNIIQNPFLGVSNTAQKLCYKFAVEFGFTPSSRSRLTVSGMLQKPLPANSMARFLAESRMEFARQRAKAEFEAQERQVLDSPDQLDIQGG